MGKQEQIVQAAERTRLQERYELRETLGRGGMGVVYRAFDTLMNREVALKTILDIENPATLDLFYKECGVLAAMVHPNIISIYDIGEFEQEGARKPFFVMPLLPGWTLDHLIHEGTARFTVETLVDIISQASRGLHAAHEMGLVHRDVKPSNIFVMNDNSVKIIDFGIARAASGMSRTSLKGTLFYMAPEQLQLKSPTPLSDQFSLAVVCYEALTRRRPFQGTTDTEVAENILRHTPPPISDLNSNVSYAVSQVVHKALAKSPYHRFVNIREFADALEKAVRNEPLEYFDSAKAKPRLERARASFDQGDFEFASELLSELEDEGYLDQDIILLRRRIENASKQRRVKQLLENSLRYFEAKEYQLSLRKLQEALELDPENTDALSLKNRVEKERREKKIDEWTRLSRQHLDNQSFQKAREALENVLKIRPNDPEALRLMAEIDRRDQEFSAQRDKKSELYKAAVQAWERGDVTGALSRLDILMELERELPDTDSGRSGTYHSFYQQVRSEHDALKNAYEQARHHLAEEDFGAAVALCREYLTKYPNHALFQALKFDVEERQRQGLSAVIAQTDRRVDQEPDLDRRVAILEEAAAKFPEESHFQTALRLVRDKRDLVNGIVAKAQYLEEREQYAEAVDQLEILRSIHPSWPGLAFEIERVTKKREQHAVQTSRTRAIQEIDRLIEGGEYERALRTIQAAAVEFPDDAELPELDKLVRKHHERGMQAQQLLNEAHELTDAGEADGALARMREAWSLDPRNGIVRTVLVNTLLEKARQLLSRDWEQAEPLLREALEVEPGHAAAQSLMNQVGDRKREEFVSWCAAQARRLQADGDVNGAVAVVDQGLSTYPRERVLEQLRSTLLRAGGQGTRTGDDLQRAMAGTAAPAGENAPPMTATPEFAATQMIPATRDFGGPASPAAATPVPPPVWPPSGAPPNSHPGSAGGPAAPPPPAPPKPAGAATGGLGSRGILAGVGALILLIIVFVAVKFFVGHKSNPQPVNPTPAPTLAEVTVRASDPRAAISVDDQACGIGSCAVHLSAGQHHASAALDGFTPASNSFEVSQGAKSLPDINLVLQARAPAMVISSNLSDGAVKVDGNPGGEIQNGEAQIADLAPGAHTIEVSGGDVQATLHVTTSAGAAPVVQLPIEQKNGSVTVLAGQGSSAHIYTTLPNADLTVDGQAAGKIANDGHPLTDVKPGAHEIVVAAGKAGTHRLQFDSGSAPVLLAFVGSERNVGTLRITTGQDDVTILVNGKPLRRNTRQGRMVIPLAPNTYRVAARKDGFAQTAEQTIEIRRGEEAKLNFELTPLPKAGQLVVRNAPPGADILVDGQQVGTTTQDGTFSSGDIPPGRHHITVRKDRFQPFQTDQSFTAGKETDVEAVLTASGGTLRIEVSPSGIGARLTVQKAGEEARAVTDMAMTLPEGDYTLSGRANGYQNVSMQVHVANGRANNVSVVFRPVVKEKAPGFTLADWDKAGFWQRDSGLLTHQGGGLGAAPFTPSAGTYNFTVLLIKGKRIEWVVAFENEKNRVDCQLDNDKFTVTQYANGKKVANEKAPVEFDRSAWVRVSINVSETSVVHTLTQGEKKYTDVSRITDAAADFGKGQFCFRIPGHDELAISDFRFTPR